MQHTLLAVTIAFILGVSLFGKLPVGAATVWWMLSGVTAAAGIAHVARRPLAASRLLLVAAAVAGLLRASVTDPLLDASHYGHRGLGQSGDWIVRAAEYPEKIGDKFVFDAWMLADARGEPATGRVRVVLRAGRGDAPEYGETLRCRGRLEPVEPETASRRWGGAMALRNRGVLGRLAIGREGWRVVRSGDGNPLMKGVYWLRLEFSDLLSATHEARTAAFLRQLVLGERTAVSRDRLDDLRRTGTMHILAQSGQHVGILALVCFFFFRLLPLGRKVPAVLTLGVLCLYALMAGGRASVLRAVLMAACIVIGILSDRKTSPFNGIALAALVVLAIDPTQLFTPGFQLSFAVTGTLLVFMPWVLHRLNRLPSFANSLLAVSLTAFVGSAPLAVHYFGSLPLVAPLANLFVMPLVSIIMPTALMALVAAMVSQKLAYVFAAANYGFVKVLFRGLDSLGQVPYAEVQLPSPGVTAILVYYLALLLIADHPALSRRFLKRQDDGEERDLPSGDWSWVLASRPMDPMLHRLERLLEAGESTGPDERDLEEVRRQLGEERCRELDPMTLQYLAFSLRRLRRAGDAGDATAAVVGALLALERELDSRLFRWLHVVDDVSRSKVARSHRKGHIGPAPRAGRDVLCLPLQNELLWFWLVPADGPSREEVARIVEGLRAHLSRHELYLDPSRLAVGLDRALKRYYYPICEGERFEGREARHAVDEILGGADRSLLRDIAAAGRLDRPVP